MITNRPGSDRASIIGVTGALRGASASASATLASGAGVRSGRTVISSSGGLPDGFPGAVPLPDGFTVQYSQASATPDGQAFVVGGTVAGDPLELAREMADGLEAAGFAQVQFTETPDSAFFGFDDGEYYVGGTLASDGDAGGSSIMNLTVGPSQQG